MKVMTVTLVMVDDENEEIYDKGDGDGSILLEVEVSRPADLLVMMVMKKMKMITVMMMMMMVMMMMMMVILVMMMVMRRITSSTKPWSPPSGLWLRPNMIGKPEQIHPLSPS